MNADVRPATADTPRPTPTTQAGRRHLSNYETFVSRNPVDVEPIRQSILAIEAEARDATGLAWMTDAVVEQAMEAAGRAVQARGGAMIEHHDQFVRDFRAALLFIGAAAPQEPRLPLGTCRGDRSVVHRNSTEQLDCRYCREPDVPPEPRWPSERDAE